MLMNIIRLKNVFQLIPGMKRVQLMSTVLRLSFINSTLFDQLDH